MEFIETQPRPITLVTVLQSVQWLVFMISGIIAVPIVVGAAFDLSTAEDIVIYATDVFHHRSGDLVATVDRSPLAADRGVCWHVVGVVHPAGGDGTNGG